MPQSSGEKATNCYNVFTMLHRSEFYGCQDGIASYPPNLLKFRDSPCTRQSQRGKNSSPASSTSRTRDSSGALPEPLKSARDIAYELAGDAVRYDPVAIAALYRKRPLQVWGRLSSVVWTFFSFALSVWLDGKTGNTATNQKRRAARLREILANSARLSSKSDKHSQHGPT